jgi:hypothetical protein
LIESGPLFAKTAYGRFVLVDADADHRIESTSERIVLAPAACRRQSAWMSKRPIFRGQVAADERSRL